MKHFVLIALISLLAAAVSAAENPVDKGSLAIAGSAFFLSQSGETYENVDGDGQTTFAFVPSLGYFVAPSLLVGGELEFSSFSWGDYSETNFSIGPIIGYYFNTDKTRTEVKGAAYPYAQAFFGYGQFKADDGTSDFTWTLTQFGGQAGVVWMMSNSIGLNLLARISSDNWDPEDFDSERGTTMMIGAGIISFIY